MTFGALLTAADRLVVDQLDGGETITYTPAAGGAVAVPGIFDRAYQKVEAGHAGVSSTGPAVFFLLADLPSDPSAEDCTVTVNGTEYSVREAAPDDKGGVRLFLQVA